MNCGEDVSSTYITSYHRRPYSPSIASSASSSAASVCFDVCSLSSDDSSVASSQSDSESSESYCCIDQPPPSFANEQFPIVTCWPEQKLSAIASLELRKHPRRTSLSARSGCPPALVRQCDRKVNFVESLVDTSAQIVEVIWPLSSVICRSEMGNKGVLPLRTFIQETLRRSRTSFSTLQVALYYLILIKPHVPKHDFTMEQPDDAHSIRALQCGRRMFLAALILASKYLQDRNYSARAWSKISGLNTLEINQNEMAFLLAVNWELHITDAVFQRWTDIVLKYTPSQPPSPGSACIAEQSADWKSVILGLNPQLDNIEVIAPSFSAQANLNPINAACLRLYTPLSAERSVCGYGSNESTPTPKYYAPSVLEPCATAASPPTRLAPALGLLPTPRLTPRSIGFNTPAVSGASCLLSKSMGFAMAHASNVCNSQSNEKWQPQFTSSPQSYVANRRSSLANTVSSFSSPESMVSDVTSRSSRSSSISSASSLMSAPISSKLDVQARCRSAKLCVEKLYRATIATVPEAYCDNGPTSPTESYTGPVGKDFLDLSLDTPLPRRFASMDYFSKDEEAARALQELHNNPRTCDSPSRVGAKRSRPLSTDYTLQENVREMLNDNSSAWPDSLVRSRLCRSDKPQSAVRSMLSTSSLGRKRVCCATGASRDLLPQSNIHPVLGGFGGPGMWEGILN